MDYKKNSEEKNNNTQEAEGFLLSKGHSVCEKSIQPQEAEGFLLSKNGFAIFTDSHCHYDDPKFDADRDTLLPAVYESGIKAIINCATDFKTMKSTLALMKKYPFVYGAMGYHPHEVKELEYDDLDRIYNYATSHPKVVAIGEIGLDYHYDFSPRDMQQEFFQEQCELALELELPVIVHSREAAQDTMEIVRTYAKADLTGVIHAYSGNLEMAREYVDMGFYLGIGGMVTFPDVKKILRTVKEIPLERLLLETDCPYLAPVPNRGKRNDSRNIPYVAAKIAELKGISVEEVAKATTENMERLFGIPLTKK